MTIPHDDLGAIGASEGEFRANSPLERELLAKNAQLEQIVNDSPTAIFTIDRTGTVLSWNSAATRILGWLPEEVLGRPLPLFENAIGSPALQMFEDEIMAGRSITRPTGSAFHKDGRTLPVVMLISPLRNEQQEIFGATFILTDETNTALAEEKIRSTEDRWAKLTDHSQEVIIVADATGTILSASASLASIVGTHAATASRQMAEIVVDEQRPALEDMLKTIVDSPAVPVTSEFQAHRYDGALLHVEITGTNQLDDPEVASIVFTARDITARHRALDLQQSQTKVFELIATGGPLDHTLESLVNMVEHHVRNAVASVLIVENDILRIGGGRGLPEHIRSTIEGTAPSQWFGCWRGALLGAGSITVSDLATSELYVGHTKQFTDEGFTGCMSFPIEDPEARKPIGALVLYFRGAADVDEHELNVASNATRLAAIALQRHRTELRLSHLAHHDKLTGLPNRALLQSRMENAVRHAQRHGSAVAIMFVDLDDFKMINDTLGHSAGDQVLVGFSDRLAKLIRPGDTVSRFGGDEFVVLLENVDGADDATPVAERLLAELQRPFRIGDKEVFLTVSVGIAVARGDDTTDMLMRHADAAMYRAKDRGRARIEIYDDRQVPTSQSGKIELESELNRALANDELELYWQPKISMATGHIVSVETLVRWNHPERGLIMPEAFIMAAEETGLILQLGKWVLGEALRQGAEIMATTTSDRQWSIAVNLSARQLAAPRFVGEVASMLRQYGWPANRLVLELTESVLMDDATDAPLHRLKQFGLELAIDDFGTGYSSLSYLHRFPVDMVKLDRAFVSTIDGQGGGSAIARAVIHMAHALGIIATAEGVESQEQLDGLRALGCDWVQGFYLAKPMPAAEFKVWLDLDPAMPTEAKAL